MFITLFVFLLVSSKQKKILSVLSVLRYYSVLEIWTISLFRNNANKRSCSAVYENI